MATRRLYRSRTDRKFAGVCGGVAEYFDIDPALVRVAAVVLFLMNGVGLLAYLVAWVAIPWRPGDQPEQAADGIAGGSASAAPGPIDHPAPRHLDLVAGGLFIAAGLMFLLMNLGLLDWDFLHMIRWRVIWPVALIALGAFVVMSSIRAQRRAGEP